MGMGGGGGRRLAHPVRHGADRLADFLHPRSQHVFLAALSLAAAGVGLGRVAAVGSVRRCGASVLLRSSASDVPASGHPGPVDRGRSAGLQPLGGAALSAGRDRRLGLPRATLLRSRRRARRDRLHALRAGGLELQLPQLVVVRGGIAVGVVGGRPGRHLGHSSCPGSSRGRRRLPGPCGRAGDDVHDAGADVRLCAGGRGAGISRSGRPGPRPAGDRRRDRAGRRTLFNPGDSDDRGIARRPAWRIDHPGYLVAAPHRPARNGVAPSVRQLLHRPVPRRGAMAAADVYTPGTLLLFDLLRCAGAHAGGLRAGRPRTAPLAAVLDGRRIREHRRGLRIVHADLSDPAGSRAAVRHFPVSGQVHRRRGDGGGGGDSGGMGRAIERPHGGRERRGPASIDSAHAWSR